MARADGGRDRDGARPGAEAHAAAPAGASDGRLTELLRADTATAYPALRELRARHHPHVLAYARLCTPSESETAVTPEGGAGDGLSLESADGRSEQRWRAGAA